MTNLQNTKRNGYIDVIKFIFAIIVLEFHMGTGIFPGGYIPVEGYFMISGYLMMNTIEKNKSPEDNLGVSTARFILNKYLSVLPYLLPAALMSFVLHCIQLDRTVEKALKYLPLLIYEVIPLRTLRFQGEYIMGVSWYISAMFVCLAILYPLCKKLKTTASLIICPILAAVFYGMLSNEYGNISMHADYLPDLPISVGLLRGFAGCALGIFMYEVCKPILNKKVTVGGRIIFTLIELWAFLYFLQTMHVKPMSKYDFVVILAIFIFLLIGISGISLSSVICNTKLAKPLGTASIIILLNHYRLEKVFKAQFGRKVHETEQLWIFLALCVASWIIAWIASKVIQLIIKNAHKIKFFKD